MNIQTLTLGPLETNCYLLWDQASGEAAVIDPAAKPEQIWQALQDHGLTLRMILLTHAHFDHIGALQALHARSGAPVFVHEADTHNPGGLSHGLLVCTDVYAEGDVLRLGGISIRVLHTPGHTPGSVCLLAQDALFSGDTLFCGSAGRTDLGGDEQALFSSLRRLGTLPDETRVFPGHGERTVLGTEKQTNFYLREAMRR